MPPLSSRTREPKASVIRDPAPVQRSLRMPSRKRRRSRGRSPETADACAKACEGCAAQALDPGSRSPSAPVSGMTVGASALTARKLVLAQRARGIIGGRATRRHGMAARHDGKGTGIFQDDDPEAFEAEFVNRMLASAAGLPRLCPLKKCRRRKRCFGPLIG